jgi:hypothetical protein
VDEITFAGYAADAEGGRPFLETLSLSCNRYARWMVPNRRCALYSSEGDEEEQVHRWRALLVAVALCALASIAGPPGLVTATSAGELEAAPGTGDNDPGELVDGLATFLWEYPTPNGLAGVVVDEQELSVDYWWKGPVPDDLLRTLEARRGALLLTGHEAQFSLGEMLAASTRIFAASRKGILPPVTGVDTPMQGNGVGVKFAPGTLTQVSETQRIVEDITRLPATVGEREAPVLMTRQDDGSQWSGGSTMSYHTNGATDCSTGFSALVPGGYGRLLSAFHCDPNRNANFPFMNGQGEDLTNGAQDVDGAPAVDSLLIDPVGGTKPYVYGGPYNAGQNHPRYQLGVYGKSAPSVGTVVCTSGANSGEHCGLTVRLATAVVCQDAPDGTCWAFFAWHNDERVAVAGGDSGGPVYNDRGDGTVTARGIINSGTGNKPCPPVRTTPTQCDYQVAFISIAGIFNYWASEGLTLETIN